jgi:hypothetical protein
MPESTTMKSKGNSNMTAVQKTPPATRAAFAVRITDGYKRIYRDVLAIGAMLVEARDALPHGEFLRMLETDLPFSQRTAYNYILEWTIAAREDLQPAASLSPSYTVRAEMERLTPAELAKGLDEGRLYQGVPREKVIEFRRECRLSQPHRPRHGDIAAPSAPGGTLVSSASPEALPACSYSELVWLLTKRRHLLGYSQEFLDQRILWTEGMTSKLEIPHMLDGRVAGAVVLSEWLQALGVGLQVVPLGTVKTGFLANI